MNVYEIEIQHAVYHNSEFSHNVHRTVLVHALNEKRAREKVELNPAYSGAGGLSLTISTSDERINRVRHCGTVVIKPYYEYSDGRAPCPVPRRRKVRK